ncbi:S-layer homology domain-containing protein [Candidatus Peregrinibacteria bacterium]|nr:S-layer homology domain-containing protein [Candidatus Peregrinibacteria bacterium]
MKNIKNLLPIFGTLLLLGALVFGVSFLSGSELKGDILESTGTSSPPLDFKADVSSEQNPDLENARNTLKNDKQNYDNRANELKNNFRNQKIDLSLLTTKMTEWNTFLSQMESALNTNDFTTFWDLNSKEDEKNQEVSDEFSKAYSFSNFSNAQNNALKEKPRQLQDTERQLKDLKRNAKNVAVDTTELDAYVTQMKDILTKMQGLANTNTSGLDSSAIDDLGKDINDLNRDFDDVNSDFHDKVNEYNDVVNIQNQIENSQKNLKDKARVIKDLEKELSRYSKTESVDVKELQNALQKMKDIYAQIETAIQKKDIDTLNTIDQDFWDANNDANDIRNSLNEASNKENQKKDTGRILKEKEKQIKDMTRECKKVSCETTETGKTFTHLQEILQKMKDTSEEDDTQSFWDVNSEFDELSREFWDTVSQKNNEKDLTRWLKDLSREMKDKGRWVADLAREAKKKGASFSSEEVAHLQEVYEKMIETLKRAEELLSGGKGQEARDIIDYEFNELRGEFDSITNDFGQKRESEFMGFEVEQIEKEIESAKIQLEEAKNDGKIDGSRLELCSGYIGEATDLLDGLKKVMAEGKVGEQEEIKIRFEKIGNKADRDCGEFFKGEQDDHEAYVKHYVRDDLQGVADEMFQKISEKLEKQFMNKLLQNLSTYQNSINQMIEESGSKWKKQLQNTFETAMPVWDTISGKENIEPLLAQKARLLSELKALDEKVSVRTQELEDLQNELTGYNFYGESASEIQDEVENFTAGIENFGTAEKAAKIKELRKKVAEAREKSREEKFKNKIIPFLDADDDSWFTRYVATLSQKNIISGYRDKNGDLTGQFGPGDPVLVGQLLKMALETAGVGEAGGTPDLKSAEDHWARGYVKQAENLGLSIVKDLDSLDRKATRGEVIRTILEAAGIHPEKISASSFKDVPASHPDLEYIEEAKNRGIVSGDGELNTFRPDDGVVRGEIAKILNNALNSLFGDKEEDTSSSSSYNDEDKYKETEQNKSAPIEEEESRSVPTI